MKKTKKSLAGLIIIPILLTSNNTVISVSYKDLVLWPVYIIIGNLDIKMHQS